MDINLEYLIHNRNRFGDSNSERRYGIISYVIITNSLLWVNCIQYVFILNSMIDLNGKWE